MINLIKSISLEVVPEPSPRFWTPQNRQDPHLQNLPRKLLLERLVLFLFLWLSQKGKRSSGRANQLRTSWCEGGGSVRGFASISVRWISHRWKNPLRLSLCPWPCQCDGAGWRVVPPPPLAAVIGPLIGAVWTQQRSDGIKCLQAAGDGRKRQKGD